QVRDPEVTRRLALSLAISGEREPALRLLEDQLLVRDRSAERARALVLALTGDSAGAARAVQAAMPGQAGAMSPFLARLPSLSQAERALAVHLGVFPNDGRTPPPNTYAANDFASAVTSAGRPDPSRPSLGRQPSPAEPASSSTRRRPAAESTAAPSSLAGVVRATTARPRQEQSVAAATPRKSASRESASPGFVSGNSAWSWSRGLEPRTARRKPEDSPKPATPKAEPREAPRQALAAASPAPSTLAPSTPAQSVPAQSEPVPVPVTPAPAQALPAAPPASAPASALAQAEPQPQSPPEVQPQPEGRALPEPQTLPAEFSIAAAQPPAPPPQAEGVPAGSRLADLSAALADIDEPKPARSRTETAKPKPAAAAAAAAKKPKAEPADPSRAWVQIAVGSAKGALPREYARLKAKAPKLLGAHAAWTAPLNSTNRLLVGPFANAKEAQSFVNQLKTEDLDGFAWTSPAGQKVEKLPAK
ncbi:MAG TPA: SPOR domain-containing protein, partial [Allosphingosinicella sp.]|nr:SPOR domain-containing protein [Allosphingosinicella sp.]